MFNKTSWQGILDPKVSPMSDGMHRSHIFDAENAPKRVQHYSSERFSYLQTFREVEHAGAS